jgi:hypothetical protein
VTSSSVMPAMEGVLPSSSRSPRWPPIPLEIVLSAQSCRHSSVVLFAAGHNPVIHASRPSWVSLFIHISRMHGRIRMFLSSERTVLSFI